MIFIELRDPLPEEEQQRLLGLKDDPEAREKLIVHNLKLVYWVARKYYNTDKNEIDDLFQQGVMGLMKAIGEYESEKGLFSTYAVMWIKQSIRRYIADTQRVIRIPVYLGQSVSNLLTAKNKLTQEFGREPTPKELSIEMGIDIRSVNEILTIVNDPVSLNNPISGEDGSITLEDGIPDTGPTPDEIIADKVFIEQFKDKIRSKLTPLEYNSIILFYGIDGKEYSLESIGHKYGKTPEQIKKVKDKGMNIIRRSKYTYGFEGKSDTNTLAYKSDLFKCV